MPGYWIAFGRLEKYNRVRIFEQHTRVSNSKNKTRMPVDLLSQNPLYEYLLDLQKKRIQLVKTLAPRRHFAWQLWICVAFTCCWLIDLVNPALKGFTITLLILLGPIALLGEFFLAGWRAQMLAVRNYPSPLDSPQALEMILSTPLTEKEITAAVVGAYIRHPFIGFSWMEMALYIPNVAILVMVLIDAGVRGSLPSYVFVMAINYYAPVFCVFLFFPLLTALDVLFIPSTRIVRSLPVLSWLPDELSGRSGRFPLLAVLLALVPVIFKVNTFPSGSLSSTIWVLTVACPIIIISTGVAILLVLFMLPGHLARIRRG